MKKMILLLAIFCMVTSASAITIQWGLTGLPYFGSTVAKVANGYTTSSYLLYLGTTGTWDLDLVKNIASGKSTNYIDKKNALAAGAMLTTGQPYVVAFGDTITSSTDKLTDGSSYFGVVYVTTKGTDTFYNVADPLLIDTTASYYNNVKEIFTVAKEIPTNLDETGVTQGWVAVPEPATGMLALAGLAMLIRRKRA